MNRHVRFGVLITTLLLCIALTHVTAQAAGVVGSGTPASCQGNALADALAGGGRVTFSCGNSPTTIIADTYVIEDDTTIRGENLITLDGEDLRQLFIVQSGATLKLENIVLLDGEFSSGGCIHVNNGGTLHTYEVTFRSCRDTGSLGGGAIYNEGTLHAAHTLFDSNRANQEGGAILNRGTVYAWFTRFESNTAGDDSGAIENVLNGVVMVYDSAFTNNSAAASGGAIGNSLLFPNTIGFFVVVRSLFVDNSAPVFGGAINNVIGDLTIENSTFVRNTADQGGAIFADGNSDTSIKFSTFVDNRADSGGAIFRNLAADVEMGYTIVAASLNEAGTTEALECDGPSVASLGYNLIEDNSCVDGSNATDIRDTPPQLTPLGDNGGFTETQMPTGSSPALAKVPAGQCLPRDQRLALRTGACDIGAAERGGLFDSAFMPFLKK